MFRFSTCLIMCASFASSLPAQEQLPLEFLAMEKVFKNAQDPHKGMMMFSSDGEALLIGDANGLGGMFRRWTRYSLQTRSYSQYGQTPADKLGQQLVDTLPVGFHYHHVANNGAELISENAARLNFFVHQSGSVVSTDENLQGMKLRVRVASVANLGTRQNNVYNGQSMYLVDTLSTDTVFLFDSEMQTVALASQKDMHKDWEQAIAGNSTFQAAFKKDNQFAMVRAGQKLPQKPRILTIAPEDNQHYCTAFYANDDKWFCVVFNGHDEQPHQIVRYDTTTGNKLGTFHFPASFQIRSRLDKKVGADKPGKLIVVTADRAAAILRVRGEHFELLADHSHLPRLALLHNKGVPFAVSPDGQTIALEVNANQFEFPAITQKGKALLRIRDVERLRSSAINAAKDMLAEASLPRGNQTLFDLRKADIPIAVQQGDEPDSIVHVIESDARDVTLSSDSRWLFAGEALFDAADGDLIERFTDYAESHFGLKRFRIVHFCLSDDARRMATISDQLTIWDLSRKDPILINSFTTKNLDEKYIDEFSEVSDFLFLPGDNQQRLLLRAKKKTWLLSIAGGTLHVLDSQPHDFFISRWGQLSYSKDGNSIYVEALGGAIRGYDISQGRFQVTSLIKPQGIQLKPQDKYSLFTRPFDLAYIHHDRGESVLQFKAGELSCVDEVPATLKNIQYDSSTGYISASETVSGGQGTRLVRMTPDLQQITQTILPPATYGRFAIAKDGRHVTVVHKKRIWILRSEFSPYSPPTAQSSLGPSAVSDSRTAGADSTTSTPTSGEPSASVGFPSIDERQKRYQRIYSEYSRIQMRLPKPLREKYQKKLADEIETYRQQRAGTTYADSMDTVISIFERIITEMNNGLE